MALKIKASSKYARELETKTELNLTPVMNLMVCLIPLLLSVSKLTDLALLEYKPPAEASEEAGGAGDDDEDKPPDEEKEIRLNLLVNLIDNDVIQISMFGKLDPGEHFYEIPASNGGYNFKALNDSLYNIKQREVGKPIGQDSLFNEDTQEWDAQPKYKVKDGLEVSITALGTTPFQTIIALMDTCRWKHVDEKRELLFPATMLKQFQ